MSDSGFLDESVVKLDLDKDTVDIGGISDTDSDSDNTICDSESDNSTGESDSPNMAQSEKVYMPLLHKCSNYSSYKTQLQGWGLLTKVEKKDRGMIVAMSLPYKDDDKDNRFNNIREKVFENIKGEDLMKVTGFKTLTDYLDKELGKDEVEEELEKYEEFDSISRNKSDHSTIQAYIADYDMKYNRIANKGMQLPELVLAFNLIKRANLTVNEKKLVMTGLDFSARDSLYEQAKKSLKKFLGEQLYATDRYAIKVEPTLIADQGHEALLAAGYVYRGRGYNSQRRGFGTGGYRGGQSFRGRGGDNAAVGRNSEKGNSNSAGRGTRPVNDAGPDGRTRLCGACGSYRHLVAQCPYSWENMKKVNVTEEEKPKEENIVMFTGYHRESLTELRVDASRCAVLDSACSSTVCGQAWMNDYIDNLCDSDKDKVTMSTGSKVFKFGGGERKLSKGCYEIPAKLAGKDVVVKTDVVDSDLPLLLSKEAMKKAKIKLDLENDTAEIMGVKVSLNETRSGHYCVPIDGAEQLKYEEVCTVKLADMKKVERQKVLLKLHRQFAHPTTEKLKILLMNAGVWQDEFGEELENMVRDCDVCKLYKKTPPRPSVALPLATEFNQVVCMDLKKWDNSWILHMIDVWSRLSVSVIINSKKPSIVVEKIMSNWIGAGFGVMGAIMTDNGGEFSNWELREVASILNVRVLTTAGESPWQNGLCERNHAVIDMMLLKLREDCKGVPISVLLCWANVAKNSLQMYYGFSSYQLVFGKNPNLPNIMTDNVAALEGTTTSETLAKHLNALHAARKAFIASEADEKIRRALRGKVRASEEHYENGERIYYKRDGSDRWLGPGSVLFQDGKIVFVRHGGAIIRVSTNRLLKAGKEIRSEERSKSDHVENTAGTNTESEEKCDKESVPYEEFGKDITSQAKDIIKAGDKIKYRMKEDDDWTNATILSRAGKATGNNRAWYNVRIENAEKDFSVNLDRVEKWQKCVEEEVNAVMVPREQHDNSECREAKQAELEKLRLFNTYEEVQDIGQSCISTTWVLTRKESGIKARLVARGFEDAEKHYVRKDSPTVSKTTIKIMIAMCANRGWKMKTTDITSAFLQGKSMERDVYLVPPKEARTEKGKLWRLKQCLYGLNDAARCFYRSVVEVLQSVGCTQSEMDPALFILKKDGKVLGVLGCHIDDFLHCGDEEFDEIVMSQIRERFKTRKLEEGNFQYVGFKLSQDERGIVLDQNDYASDIDFPTLPAERMCAPKNELLTCDELTTLRSIVGKLNWMVQGTRPDLGFDMIDLSTKLRKGTIGDIVLAQKAVKRLKSSDSYIVFPYLGNVEKWELIVFSDAAHANLNDGVGSAGAHIVLLVGDNNACCPLAWHMGKIKRIVRSTIAAEALSLQEGLEEAVYVKTELRGMIGRDIPIMAYIDNKSVVEAIHSTKFVDDKRLRLDIAAIRQSLENEEIASVRWCPGPYQLANVMTKRGAAATQLLNTLQAGLLNGMNNL